MEYPWRACVTGNQRVIKVTGNQRVIKSKTIYFRIGPHLKLGLSENETFLSHFYYSQLESND